MPDQPQDSGQHPTTPAGGEVERWEPDDLANMVPFKDGDWVRYEDYEKLKRELDSVRRWTSVPVKFAQLPPDLQEILRNP